MARDRGAMLTEYGVLIFFVAIAAFGILAFVGGEVWELFRDTSDEFNDVRQVQLAPD